MFVIFLKYTLENNAKNTGLVMNYQAMFIYRTYYVQKKIGLSLFFFTENINVVKEEIRFTFGKEWVK